MAARDYTECAGYTKETGSRFRDGPARPFSRQGIHEIHAGCTQPGPAVGRETAAQLAESTSFNPSAFATALALAGLIDQHCHTIHPQPLRVHPPVLGYRAALDYPLLVRHQKSARRYI